MSRSFLFFLFLVFPHVSFAAVVINEIAWMGDSTSANNEWIELYNNGPSTVDVTGWTLSDGGSLNISLTGEVQSEQYVLLERNRAIGTYKQNPPFLIYSGALVNTGATWTLKNSSGAVVDQVAGGEGWSIGGDNVSKDTAQYTVSGWITAAPTAGYVNRTTGTISNGSNSSTTSTTTPSGNTNTTGNTTTNTSTNTSSNTTSGTGAKTSSNKTTVVRFILPPNSLRLTPDIQTVGYVNQLIPFVIQPTGIGETLTESLVYDWNFGDMSTSTLKNPYHIYQYPGTYVVTVKASYARQVAIARHEITILPVEFSITRNSRGDVQINNDSPYEVDMSGYKLVGDIGRLFPPRTVLLPKNTITVPYSRIANSADTGIALYDARGEFVTATWIKNAPVQTPAPLTATVLAEDVTDEAIPTETPNTEDDSFTFVTDDETFTDDELPTSTSTASPAEVINILPASKDGQDWAIGPTRDKWALVWVGLLVSVIVGLALTKK